MRQKKKPEDKPSRTGSSSSLPAPPVYSRRGVGGLNKRQLLELIFNMEREILVEIGGIKQQLDIVANQQFLQETMKQREEKKHEPPVV